MKRQAWIMIDKNRNRDWILIFLINCLGMSVAPIGAAYLRLIKYGRESWPGEAIGCAVCVALAGLLCMAVERVIARKSSLNNYFTPSLVVMMASGWTKEMNLVLHGCLVVGIGSGLAFGILRRVGIYRAQG
jgi:hypothetical protein